MNYSLERKWLPILIQVRPEMRNNIDSARGNVPLSSWVRTAIEEKLAREQACQEKTIQENN